jgi:hypothetical protein
MTPTAHKNCALKQIEIDKNDNKIPIQLVNIWDYLAIINQ